MDEALRRCPFLSAVVQREGCPFAQRLALAPFAPAAASSGPVLEEEGLSGRLHAAAHRFHGPDGVVPLARFAAPQPLGPPAAQRPSGCPFLAAAAAEAAAKEQPPAAPQPAAAAAAAARPAACRAAAAPHAHLLGRAPMASISISGFGFMPDPGQFFNRPPRGKKQQQPQQRKPADPAGSSSSSSSTSSSRGGSAGSGGARPGAASSASSPSVSSGRTSGSGAARPRPGGGSGRAGHAGQPGWKRVLGGLIPLAAGGHMTCPAPIVKMRAAVAALKPVRDLRPQALPIRALAMSGTAIAAGLPSGAWREHTRKFSPQWFLAVHAAVPFVAMLRKAVLMPRWAILLTLLGSIAGQQLGARLERERMLKVSASRAAGAAQGAPLPADCLMPGLDAGCRAALQSARSALAWTLNPTVTVR